MEEGEESVENLENTRGLPTCEWVSKAAPRREIKNRFKHFLRTFVDSKGDNVFFRKIQDMCSHNRQSFEIEYSMLVAELKIVTSFLMEAPAEMLPILDEAAKVYFLLYSCILSLYDSCLLIIRWVKIFKSILRIKCKKSTFFFTNILFYPPFKICEFKNRKEPPGDTNQIMKIASSKLIPLN